MREKLDNLRKKLEEAEGYEAHELERDIYHLDRERYELEKKLKE